MIVMCTVKCIVNFPVGLCTHCDSMYASFQCMYVCMSQRLGSEVERQGKQVNYTQDSSFQKRRRVTLGGIRTHDTLQSRRALYQLSYQGNSAGTGSNLNTTQYLKPLCYGTVHSHLVCTPPTWSFYCFCIFHDQKCANNTNYVKVTPNKGCRVKTEV